MRELQHEDKSLFGAKLQVTWTTFGGRQLAWLLLAACLMALPASAQTADDTFGAALAELREASFADKETIADRLIATGRRGSEHGGDIGVNAREGISVEVLEALRRVQTHR